MCVVQLEWQRCVPFSRSLSLSLSLAYDSACVCVQFLCACVGTAPRLIGDQSGKEILLVYPPSLCFLCLCTRSLYMIRVCVHVCMCACVCACVCVCAYVFVCYKQKLGPGHTIVTLICDGGERYVSKLYSANWLREHEYRVPSEKDIELGR